MVNLILIWQINLILHTSCRSDISPLLPVPQKTCWRRNKDVIRTFFQKGVQFNSKYDPKLNLCRLRRLARSTKKSPKCAAARIASDVCGMFWKEYTQLRNSALRKLVHSIKNSNIFS